MKRNAGDRYPQIERLQTVIVPCSRFIASKADVLKDKISALKIAMAPMTTALVRSLENTAHLSALDATDPDTNSGVANLHHLRVPQMHVLTPAGSFTTQRDRDQVVHLPSQLLH